MKTIPGFWRRSQVACESSSLKTKPHALMAEAGGQRSLSGKKLATVSASSGTVASTLKYSYPSMGMYFRWTYISSRPSSNSKTTNRNPFRGFVKYRLHSGSQPIWSRKSGKSRVATTQDFQFACFGGPLTAKSKAEPIAPALRVHLSEKSSLIFPPPAVLGGQFDIIFFRTPASVSFPLPESVFFSKNTPHFLKKVSGQALSLFQRDF